MRSSIPQDDDPPIDRPHRTGRSAKERPCAVATSAFFSFTSISSTCAITPLASLSYLNLYKLRAPRPIIHPQPIIPGSILARITCEVNSGQHTHCLIIHTMGGSLSRIWSLLWSKKEIRILILGLVRYISLRPTRGKLVLTSVTRIETNSYSFGDLG